VPIDIRGDAARFYDLSPGKPNDIDFYRERIPARDAAVLELGCGTGRVLVPLSAACGYIHGVDASSAMISICEEKLARENVPGNRARVEVGDITDLSLSREFDLIIAPFRVLQNLETDDEVDGLFDTIREHLSSGGKCILNVFNPNRDSDTMRREWVNTEEYSCWETETEGDRVTCHGRNARMDPERMVLYPELTYRRYCDNRLSDEATLKIVMRCYYPDEFERLITGHGFDVVGRLGGYAGEAYGEGPELVITFGGSG
jgi:SAM-dependent methyltransferase